MADRRELAAEVFRQGDSCKAAALCLFVEFIDHCCREYSLILICAEFGHNLPGAFAKAVIFAIERIAKQERPPRTRERRLCAVNKGAQALCHT